MKLLLSLLALLLVVSACSGSGGDTTTDGKIRVVFWHGQNDTSKKVLDTLVAEFNRTHPTIQVESDSGGVLADQMTVKLTAALAAGSYPDVAYLYGSDLASLARSPKVADLTGKVADWNDFWPAERDAAQIDGKIRGVPALVDDLGLVYNKKLFDAAGVAYPNENWSWDDFTAAAKRLTDSAAGTFGTGWPGAANEDTTWRLWPMIWQQGGEILTADHSRTAFDTPAGAKAMGVIGRLASDKSVFVDTDPTSERMNQLFNSGRLGMLIAGPWVLPDLNSAGIDYGVARLPGVNGNHTTIAGPDNWVVFDNGSARTAAATVFATWLADPAQDTRWTGGIDNMPVRQATTKLPGYTDLVKRVAGVQTFVDTLAQAKARPPIPAYPKLSTMVGQAIVSVLLGQSNAEAALHKAAQDGDQALRGS